MYRILGINDDVTTCECCGKSNLKATVVLGTDSGEVHFGRQCAAIAIRGEKSTGTVKVIESQAKAISVAKKWLSKGFDAWTVCNGIAARYGYPCEYKNGEIKISDFGVIKA